MEIEIYECKITRYGYRKKLATRRIFKIRYKSGDAVDQLKQQLADEADDGGPDNHETYVLEKDDNNKIVVQFSDWTMYVGTEVQKWGY